MAEIKKYLDSAALGALVDQIKAEDSKVKAYVDQHIEQAGKLYDVAGAAATVQGKLDEEVTRAKAREDEIAGLVATAQGEVDALETLVGTLPDGTTATSVVDYVNVKTAGIATDAALEELQGQVTAAQEAIDAIEADYLKAADKTELADAIAAEASRADIAEKANAASIKAISDDYLKAADKEELEGSIAGVAEDVAEIAGDYLKAADKTELEGKINAKADQTSLDKEISDRETAVSGLQTQINTIMNNPDAEGAINSINEFSSWVAEHGTVADGMRADINKNKEDIASMDTAYKAADTLIQGRLDTLEAIDHEAYVAADTALKNELNAEIAKKAVAADVAATVEALTAADTAMQGRLNAIEAQLGDGEGSVADMIADAKQEAIDSAVATAASDAAQKASAAETAAKNHADSLNTAMAERMAVVEGAKHTHDNKALLDTYAQTEANLADAVAKKHEHANAAVLNGINEDKVELWDTVSSKASQSDFDTLSAKVDGNTSALNSFTPITSEEVAAMFA